MPEPRRGPRAQKGLHELRRGCSSAEQVALAQKGWREPRRDNARRVGARPEGVGGASREGVPPGQKEWHEPGRGGANPEEF